MRVPENNTLNIVRNTKQGENTKYPAECYTVWSLQKVRVQFFMVSCRTEGLHSTQYIF